LIEELILLSKVRMKMRRNKQAEQEKEEDIKVIEEEGEDKKSAGRDEQQQIIEEGEDAEGEVEHEDIGEDEQEPQIEEEGEGDGEGEETEEKKEVTKVTLKKKKIEKTQIEKPTSQKYIPSPPETQIENKEAVIASQSGYSSPFKRDMGEVKNYLEKSHIKENQVDEIEFPDKDVEMKIRDKDVVFIYEIDDMIKNIVKANEHRSLDEENDILQILNRFSKVFRHYIRYRVVEIGDMVGGLFLDGFWKTLLITIDKILHSIDNRYK
jgi:hypothetical protein